VTYLEFTAIKWYMTTVTIARTPRVLAREYKVSWVMVTVRECGCLLLLYFAKAFVYRPP